MGQTDLALVLFRIKIEHEIRKPFADSFVGIRPLLSAPLLNENRTSDARKPYSEQWPTTVLRR